MRWLRRVWDGPFRTPPLEQPITVGWVFLKIIETIWRAFLIVILLIALVIAGAWISERNPLSSQIAVSLSPSASCQKDGYPIRASFLNKSSKTIGEIDVRLRVYPQGKSVDVASYSGSRQELHDIVRPGEEIAYCFSMPQVELGSTGPFTIAADVTYAAELSKEVPVSALPAPPPIVQIYKGSETGPTPPKSLWSKISDTAGAVLFLVMLASGGFGLITLFDLTFKTRFQDKLLEQKSGERGCVAILFISLMNALIVVAAGYALNALGWDRWIMNLDAWSRGNGYSDAGMMLLTAAACQWPWLVVMALAKSRSELTAPATNAPQ